MTEERHFSRFTLKRYVTIGRTFKPDYLKLVENHLNNCESCKKICEEERSKLNKNLNRKDYQIQKNLVQIRLPENITVVHLS